MSRQRARLDPRALRWKPRTGFSGSACMYFPFINPFFHSASVASAAHLLQQYWIVSRLSLSNTTPSHVSGCNSPQCGHGTFHSPCELCWYSNSILEVPLFPGVDTYTSLLFQKVVSRSDARKSGSPSVPAVAGYLSTSSASSTCTGREAREVGLFAPTMAILPPGNTFSSMVFPAPRRSLIIPRNTGVSCMDFASLFLEKLSAIVIVGCIIRIGTGS